MGQEEDRQAELYAAFEALGGQLTWDELTRLLGSDEYRPALVWQVMLLLGGDAAAAEEVVQASFAVLQDARSQLSDPAQARLWLYRAVASRARSVRRHQGVSHRGASQPAADRGGARQAATVGLARGSRAPRAACPSTPTARGSCAAHLYGPVRGAGRAGDGHQYRGGQKPPGRGHVLAPAPAPAGMIPQRILRLANWPMKQMPVPAWSARCSAEHVTPRWQDLAEAR